MAELTKDEWKLILGRQSPADLKFLIALLRRDGVVSIPKDWER